MHKIPTCFLRDPVNLARLLREPHPACAWVFAGEGKATRKYDGTCCLVRDGALFKRRELKLGKPIPWGFELIETDDATGKSVGWMPCNRDDPSDRWHYEAFDKLAELQCDIEGTYELVGPKIQGNPEGFASHTLLRHEYAETFPDCPRTYDGLWAWLQLHHIEGIVFHHMDERMAKIKKRDFGLKR